MPISTLWTGVEVMATADSRAGESAKDVLQRISSPNVDAPTEPKAIDFRLPTGQDLLSGLDLSQPT